MKKRIFVNFRHSTQIAFGVRAVLLVFLTLGALSSAVADAYLCDGVWKSQPCADGNVAQKKLDAPKTSPAKAARSSEYSAKKALIDELRSFRFQIEREHGLRRNFPVVERNCLKADTSIEACRKEVTAARKELREEALIFKQSSPSEEEEVIAEIRNESQEVVVVNQQFDERTFIIDPNDRRLRREGSDDEKIKAPSDFKSIKPRRRVAKPTSERSGSSSRFSGRSN